MTSLDRLFVPLAFSFLTASLAPAQGFAPRAAEEAKVIAVLDLTPGRVAAEIGAGDGQLAIKAARAVAPGGRVYASELGDSKISALKRSAAAAKLQNLEVVAAQPTATGLDPSCCDAIFMRDVYHHFTAPDQILADLRKALRPSGRLLIIDFEPRGSLPSVDGVRENRRGHGIPMTILVAELTAAGFDVVSEDPSWREDLYAVVARQPAPPAQN